MENQHAITFQCEICNKSSEFDELPSACPHCQKPLSGIFRQESTKENPTPFAKSVAGRVTTSRCLTDEEMDVLFNGGKGLEIFPV